MNAIFFVCGLTAIACVVLISVYMIIAGVPAIGKIGFIDFLFGTKWASTAAEPSYGILPFILTSIYGTVGAILIGVPVGLLTAVFLSKIAPRGLAAPVSTAVELLAGIPSVVYGLLGMTLLVPAVAKTFGIASGACLFSAILVLALMILPNIVSWRWAPRRRKPISKSAFPLQKAALPPAWCWASAAPLARPWL